MPKRSWTNPRKGHSFEEIHGSEKSDQIKTKMGLAQSERQRRLRDGEEPPVPVVYPEGTILCSICDLPINKMIVLSRDNKRRSHLSCADQLV